MRQVGHLALFLVTTLDVYHDMTHDDRMTREHTAARLPDATAIALARHLLSCVIASTPDLHEAAAAQVGEILVVEATFETGPDYSREWSAVRFEVDQDGNFTSTFDADALRMLDAEREVERACRCGSSYCDDCRGSRRGRRVA